MILQAQAHFTDKTKYKQRIPIKLLIVVLLLFIFVFVCDRRNYRLTDKTIH